MRLTGNLPHFIECLLRPEFCFDGEAPEGEPYYPGYLTQFTARPGQAPAFNVQLHNGAQWARVPLHMLCFEPCEVLPIEHLCWWDCFSHEFEPYVSALHRGVRCSIRGRDNVTRSGRYLFTIDWIGEWADLPDQHKFHHFVQLDSGHLAAAPNNKMLFQDASWFVPGPMPRWKANTHSWSCENTATPFVDGSLRDYQPVEKPE